MKNFEFSYNEIPDDPDMVLIRYLEVSSKNKQGGLKRVSRKRKLVDHYERVTNDRGFYYWLKEYLQHCRSEALDFVIDDKFVMVIKSGVINASCIFTYMRHCKVIYGKMIPI